MLVHGPLLAYGKVCGDDLIIFTAQDQTYSIPKREGIPIEQYPYDQHAEKALTVAKSFLQNNGFWTWPEEPVNRVNPDNWASSKKEENVFQRTKALHGAQYPNKLPQDTVLTVFHGSIPTFI